MIDPTQSWNISEDCCVDEEGEDNAGNEGIDDGADAEEDEDVEDRDRDNEGKSTAKAVKGTLWE